jgi:hypothetical protein
LTRSRASGARSAHLVQEREALHGVRAERALLRNDLDMRGGVVDGSPEEDDAHNGHDEHKDESRDPEDAEEHER